MTTISRTIILAKLAEWADGKISPVETHKWAQDIFSSDEIEFTDTIPSKGFSVAREALAEIEMLDINLITEDDIPIFVEFLNAAPDQFETAYIKFVAALQEINRDARIPKLKNTSPYKTHY